MIPTWERLIQIRHLGIYSFAKWAIILIPIIASVTAFVETHTQYQPSMPVNLLCLYGSSLVFYASGLFTDLFCPGPIKEHGNFEKNFVFLSSNTDSLSEMKRRTAARIEEILDKLQMEVTRGGQPPPPTGKTESLLDELVLEQATTEFLDGARARWDEHNKEDLTPLRAVIGLAYLVAATLGLYVTFWDAPMRVIAASQ